MTSAKSTIAVLCLSLAGTLSAQHRDLRRDFVFGAPKDAGDRRAAVAGRDGGRRTADDSVGRAAAGGDRRGGGRRGCAGGGGRNREHAVPQESAGRADFCAGAGGVAGGGGARLLDSGDARDAYRPVGGAARRVKAAGVSWATWAPGS